MKISDCNDFNSKQELFMKLLSASSSLSHFQSLVEIIDIWRPTEQLVPILSQKLMIKSIQCGEYSFATEFHILSKATMSLEVSAMRMIKVSYSIHIYRLNRPFENLSSKWLLQTQWHFFIF